VIRATDRIIAPTRGTADEAVGYARTHNASCPGFAAEYIDTVYDLCVPNDLPDAAIVIGQSAHETADPFPWQSFWWEMRGNPAGIGITGDPVQNTQSETFETGDEAARAHVSHLLLYATGEINRGGLTPADDPRYDAYIEAYGHKPMAITINGLTGKWGVDPQYASGVVKWGNRIFPDIPNQGGTSVATYSTAIPGLPGGPLQTTHPIQIKLIPDWRTNNRPGITARTPRRSVQHGNGNPRSSAAGEANYLYNGAEGRQASYHSSTDDKETWIMVPANEVTWQAADGSGPGNMNGFSNEMVEDATLWANPTRRDRVIANAAELMGGIAARLDIDKPEQHYTFNYDSADRHDCPNRLRYTTINGKPAWDIYAEKWRAAKGAERARMQGEPTTPTKPPVVKPIYADAVTAWMGNDLKEGWPSDHSFTVKVEGIETKVKVWGAQREYECVKSTPRYQGPDIKGKKVGGNLVVREQFVGSYFAVVGTTRWTITRYGSWIRADALTPRVSVRAT
jgi:N-acetylmuramoyl-L-alanine amidase CwlA